MRCVSHRNDIFFFNDTATTEIYTLSLHDALPISSARRLEFERREDGEVVGRIAAAVVLRDRLDLRRTGEAAEEDPVDAGQIGRHTSELQSRQYLVCRLLLEKKTYIDYRLSFLLRL